MVQATTRPEGHDLTGLPGYGIRRRYYTPEELNVHNCAEDCWVAVLGHVYDLTTLIQDNMGPLVKPLIELAGQDISYLFDRETGDPKIWIEPVSNLPQYYLPCGRVLDIPPMDPDATWKCTYSLPWWKSPDRRIGRLTKKTRRVIIVNTLTRNQVVLTVCSEETISEIRDRYLEHNAHAASYTWKKLQKGTGASSAFVVLDMQATLEQNNIKDESAEFELLGINEDSYLPIIHVYFNDDLTIA